jgi:DNA modification methylase
MSWQNRIVGAGTEDPEKLIPHPKNWRKHPKGQAQALEGAIEEIGWIQDIIINQRTGRMIDGHLRAELAIKNKEKFVPVKYVDLSEEEEEKALLTLDPISMMAEADKDRLSALLQNITSDNEKVNQLLEDIGREYKVSTKKAEEDNYVPPPEIETDIVRGDIFHLGRHRVMCGDSTCREDVERLTDGKKADMVFTDPPYGVSYSEKNTFLNSISRGNRIQTPIEQDNCSEKEIMVFWKSAFEIIRDQLAPINSYYIFGPQIQGMMMMMMMMMESGLPYRHVLIWVKNNHVLGRTDYNYQHEPIFFGWTTKHEFYGAGQFKTSVWEVDKPLKNDLHPTMKPVALVENALLNSSLSDMICLDPFLGSGTTLIACEQLDRICFGMEISPQYCEVICQRWEKFTGKKREKVCGVDT